MPHHNALIADPFDFARQGGVMQGEATVGTFARLTDVLREAGADQPVRYGVRGEQIGDVTGRSRSFLVLQVTADVLLGCQRCLGDVSCHVEAATRLLLVREDEDMPDEDLVEDDFDPIQVGRNLDVMALVEDELLLALPFAPMHEDCSVPGDEGGDKPASPFAVLSKLKRGN